jgi:putative pyruvate formate lyase activating enzyme
MAKDTVPAYVKLLASGRFDERLKWAYSRMRSCDLCPRCCGVNRLHSNRGAWCRTGSRAEVASFGAHFGEEQPLVGQQGSGTIFFGHCNLGCAFCQNWDISQPREPMRPVSATTLAAMMLSLQRQGCHNINLVSPSHVVAPILAAVRLAARRGLRLPLVYNSGGYDCPHTLAILDGIVDIYMPDMKFADSGIAAPLLGVPDYAEVNRAAVRIMQQQVGDLRIDHRGIAYRGLLVRHLILPENLAGTERIVAFLSEQVSRDTYINLMNQYHPCHRAAVYPPLDRRPTLQEVHKAHNWAKKSGLWRFDTADEKLTPG